MRSIRMRRVIIAIMGMPYKYPPPLSKKKKKKAYYPTLMSFLFNLLEENTSLFPKSLNYMALSLELVM